MRTTWRLLLCLAIATLLSAIAIPQQQRYTSGPWKGFLMGRPEGLPMSFLPAKSGPNFNGTVKVDGGAALAGVTVELRGPAEKTDIRAAKTDAAGHFSFQSLPEGAYKLKATRDGYGSAVGELNVSNSRKNAPLMVKVRYAM